MATTVNYKNDNVAVITGIQTIPNYSVKTGTINANNLNVVGTGTSFTTQVKEGDFICDPINYEVRKVKDIRDDNFLTIDHPFSNSVAGLALQVISRNDLVQEVYANIKNGSPDGVVDGVAMKNGAPYLWGRRDTIETATPRTVDPITFNGTGTTINITTVK